MSTAPVNERRVHAVIQARMGSSRRPGKVLDDLGGRTVLGWVVRAAQTADGLDRVVVATSTEAADDPVAELARELGADVVRGPEHDVLGRFLLALDAFPGDQPDAVVRLTADCPLLDPELIALVVDTWRADPEWDYVSTTLVRTLPRGLDVELARSDALRRLGPTARGHVRVHVTSGLYADPERYRLHGLTVDPPADDLRVTLDTAEDAAALAALVAVLGDSPPAWRDVVATLRARPDIVAINAHVQQKALEAG
jgi:spore coat polysaccharide biosynthesis protein SpsF